MRTHEILKDELAQMYAWLWVRRDMPEGANRYQPSIVRKAVADHFGGDYRKFWESANAYLEGGCGISG